MIQFFESWAHHLGPTQFETYAKPYADRAMRYVKARHPEVPLVYYANGGSSYLPEQRDMACDMLSLDWACDLAQASLGTSAPPPIRGPLFRTGLSSS